jgi:hypothetical protein
MTRLIDRIQSEIQNNSLITTVRYIILDDSSISELLSDFKEEFEIEYLDLGREPSFLDLQDYLSAKIIKEKLPDGEKYKLLVSV